MCLSNQTLELSSDLGGEPLRVGAIHWAHYVLLEPLSTDADSGRIEMLGDLWGFEVELLAFMQKRLNFRPEPVVVSAGNWGGVEKVNGTWGGMAGYLAFDRAEAIIGDCSMNFDRSQVPHRK